MTLPNFLIIGSAKGGTSSLHYYLRQHPQIFMPDLKEPRFFALEGGILNFQNPDSAINYNSITTLREYESLFANVTNELGIGEASPLYLYSEKAARRIKHYVPDAKLMVILRNPVDRAFSCYTHLLREGYETLSFEAALKAESEEDKITGHTSGTTEKLDTTIANSNPILSCLIRSRSRSICLMNSNKIIMPC